MTEDVAERLAAQTLRWRLILGVASWGLALASSAFVGLVLAGVSFVHVEGTARLVAYSVPMILSFVAAGYALLRVGEIDLATGKLVRAAPVAWPSIFALVLAMSVVFALAIAWPLGVYTSLRASGSSCGALVPIDTLRSLTTEPLSYAMVTFDDGGCDVGIVASGHAALAVLIRERAAPDDHEWGSLVSRFHPDRREPLSIAGADEALLLENADVFVIAMRVGREGRFVQLRRDVFDHADALALADRIE